MGGRNSRRLSNEELQSLESSTNFSGNEILDWYHRFHEDFPAGIIKQKDFIQMYSKIFPVGDAKNFAALVFKSYDKDGNGEIDFQEFMATAIYRMKGEFENDKADKAALKIFNVLDKDKDRELTIDELIYGASKSKTIMDILLGNAETH